MISACTFPPNRHYSQEELSQTETAEFLPLQNYIKLFCLLTDYWSELGCRHISLIHSQEYSVAFETLGSLLEFLIRFLSVLSKSGFTAWVCTDWSAGSVKFMRFAYLFISLPEHICWLKYLVSILNVEISCLFNHKNDPSASNTTLTEFTHYRLFIKIYIWSSPLWYFW